MEFLTLSIVIFINLCIGGFVFHKFFEMYSKMTEMRCDIDTYMKYTKTLEEKIEDLHTNLPKQDSDPNNLQEQLEAAGYGTTVVPNPYNEVIR